MKVKRILKRLEQVLRLDMAQCPEMVEMKGELDQEGDEYVNAQFENNNEWLKYVNDSISMKKTEKVHAQTKWMGKLGEYRELLQHKYKKSRLQIQSVVVTLDLIQKLMEG